MLAEILDIRILLELDPIIFVVQCNNNLPPSRRRGDSDLLLCERRVDISISLSNTVN